MNWVLCNLFSLLQIEFFDLKILFKHFCFALAIYPTILKSGLGWEQTLLITKNITLYKDQNRVRMKHTCEQYYFKISFTEGNPKLSLQQVDKMKR